MSEGPYKFKIYLPTSSIPRVNNGLLPWVYDQDRSSGFMASMWVTPVETLLPAVQQLLKERPDAVL